jgi:hypothetical protein
VLPHPAAASATTTTTTTAAAAGPAILSLCIMTQRRRRAGNRCGRGAGALKTGTRVMPGYAPSEPGSSYPGVPVDQGPPQYEVPAGLVASLRRELAEALGALEETRAELGQARGASLSLRPG